MASNRFQEGLKNYRDLLQLNRNLDRWVESLGAFDDILDTRQRAYVQRLPNIDASLSSVDLPAMAARRVELESRLQAIERSEDVVALGTAKEQETWARIVAMEPKLALLPNDAESEEMRTKHRFLRGLLLWDLRRDYKARLWAERKALGDLDRQLREAQRRHHQVASARDDWPEKFAALTARIEGLRRACSASRSRAQVALMRQQQFLQGIAVDELKAQRDRLNTYMVQARFALASIYDRAAARVEPAPETRPRRSRRAANDQRAAARPARDRGDLAVRPRSRPRREKPSSRRARSRISSARTSRWTRTRRSSAAKRRRWRAIACFSTSRPTIRCSKPKRCGASPTCSSRRRTSRSSQATSSRSATLGSTIDMYEQLLESYPNYAKNDLVLYQLARAYEAEGRIDDSLATLDRLIAAVSAHGASRRGAVPPRRDVVRAEALPRLRAAYAYVLEEGDALRRSTSSRSTSTVGRCSSSSSTRTA